MTLYFVQDEDMWDYLETVYSGVVMVNTVNCVGVMGKGVAKQFRERYPEMYQDYRTLALAGEIKPGKLYTWATEDNHLEIVNFPTKRHWRDKSRLVDIRDGLKELRILLENRPDSVIVTLPPLGCGNGGLEWADVKVLIEKYLGGLSQSIYVFEPSLPVDLKR